MGNTCIRHSQNISLDLSISRIIISGHLAYINVLNLRLKISVYPRNIYISKYIFKYIYNLRYFVSYVQYLLLEEDKRIIVLGQSLGYSIMNIPIVCDVHRWMRELFTKGAKRDLEESDIYRPLKVDESKKVTDHLEK